MVSKRAVAALFLSQMLAGVGFAQSVAPSVAAPDASVAAPDEFGRVSGGELDLIAKHPQRLSGSFGIGISKSQLPFANGGSGTTNRYNATLGGTIVPDRVWFFASAQKSDALFASPFGSTLARSGALDSRRIDTNMSAQIGDRQSLAASFAGGRELSGTTAVPVAAPTSFLSLRYTGMVSSNGFFSATFSRHNSAQPELFVIQPR